MDNLSESMFPRANEYTGSREGDEGAIASAFGAPYSGPGGKMIIPVARVVQVNRSGGEGGDRRVVTSIPRAVIEVDERGARVKEITNSMVLGLAGMCMAAWNMFWIAKTIRAFARKR